MSIYTVKEIFGPTIEGEGHLTGTAVRFVRFAGCNKWNGQPETKPDSVCYYCDTDFVGGQRLTKEDIVTRLEALGKTDWIMLSGGEPMLQVDLELLKHLSWQGYKINIETNGSVAIPDEWRTYIDCLTMSPKDPIEKLKQLDCDCLKVLYPHKHLPIEQFEQIEATYKYIQPVFGHESEAVEKVLKENGKWRLSLQIHKYLNVD